MMRRREKCLRVYCADPDHTAHPHSLSSVLIPSADAFCCTINISEAGSEARNEKPTSMTNISENNILKLLLGANFNVNLYHSLG